jgi:hypothetical protein
MEIPDLHVDGRLVQKAARKPWTLRTNELWSGDRRIQKDAR